MIINLIAQCHSALSPSLASPLAEEIKIYAGTISLAQPIQLPGDYADAVHD